MPSNTVPESYVRAYANTLDLLVAAPGMTAMELFRVERFTGERKDFPQASGVQLKQKTGRAQEIDVVDVEMRLRWIARSDYWARDWLDSMDKIRMLADPTNVMLEAFATACKVKALQVACSAAIGTAYAGKMSTTEVALPASQQIANGGTGFTLDKLKDAVKRLRKKGGLAPGARPQVLWTSDQEAEFINTTEVKSSDFNNEKVMVDGELKKFYGCDFHRLDDYFDPIKNETAAIIPKAGNIRSVIVYDKSGVALGLPESDEKMTKGSVDWDKDRWSWQIGAAISVGASRFNDYKVVQTDCVEN